MSLRNQGRKWIWDPTRVAIYLRDGCRCVWCGYQGRDTVPRTQWRNRPQRAFVGGTGGLSLDHLTPKSQGGSNKPSNLVTACCDCNTRRNDRSIRLFARELGLDAERLRAIRTHTKRPIDRTHAKRCIAARRVLPSIKEGSDDVRRRIAA